MPAYSIILPTYNRAHWLSESLDSIFQQTFKDYEIVVCDDGSTDGTSRLLEGYGDRIRCVRTHRLGPGGARNAAIAVARGTCIACLDSDDTWMPWTLDCIDRTLQAASGDCLVYLAVSPMRDETKWRNHAPEPLVVKQYDDFFSAPLSAPHGSCSIGAIPRRLLDAIGGFDETLPVASDHDLALRLGAGIPYCVIHAPVTLFYRTHGDNISHSAASIRVDSYVRMIAKEMREQAYPGGRARRRERRIRIGRMAADHALRFVAACEYRQALRLYRRSLGLMISVGQWRFAALFPLLAALHLRLNTASLFGRGDAA